MNRMLASAGLGCLLVSSGCTLWSEFYTIRKEDGGDTGTGGSGANGGAGGSPAICTPGEQQECPYSGPPGTKDVGNCHAAVMTCNVDGSAYSTCENEVLPQLEDCSTTADEDCDGSTPPCDGSCVWSKAFGDVEHQQGADLALDAAGNLLVGGVFKGTIGFGGESFTSATGALFLTKLSGEGNHLWSRGFGNPSSIFGASIAVGPNGNTYTAGAFQGTINFGDLPLSAQGGWDVFTAMQAATGAPAWALAFGDTAYQATQNVAVDASGNVLLAGEFSGAANFGGDPLVSGGGVDAFVAKLDGQGAHLWSRRFGDPATQVARALAVDASGNVIFAGMYGGTVNFGGSVLASRGDLDVFVAKLDPSGAHLWSRSFGDANKQSVHDLAVDASGDIVLSGSFSGTIDLGGGALAGDHPENIFAAKLTGADGSHVWSKAFGDAANQASTRVAFGTGGGVILAGGFAGTVDFGGGALAALGDDAFVAKLTADGSHVWSKRFGDPDNQAKPQWVSGIVTNNAGDLFLTGFFEGKIDFGCGPLTSAGAADAFVARLTP